MKSRSYKSMVEKIANIIVTELHFHGYKCRVLINIFLNYISYKHLINLNRT